MADAQTKLSHLKAFNIKVWLIYWTTKEYTTQNTNTFEQFSHKSTEYSEKTYFFSEGLFRR